MALLTVHVRLGNRCDNCGLWFRLVQTAHHCPRGPGALYSTGVFSIRPAVMVRLGDVGAAGWRVGNELLLFDPPEPF